MQKLRSTFKRSRTPTGAEMKTQSSLEVPKQIRSASFDEIQLQTKLQDDGKDVRTASGSPSRTYDRRRSATLKVPQMLTGQRSKSFDAYSGSSSSQQSSERSETPIIQVSGCYHCACVEEYRNLIRHTEDNTPRTSESHSDSDAELSEGNDESDHEENGSSRREGSPEIMVTLPDDDDDDNDRVNGARNEPRCVSPIVEPTSSEMKLEASYPGRQRRRSLSRQEALTTFPLTEISAVVLAATKDGTEARTTASVEPDDDDDDEENYVVAGAAKSQFVVRDIFLTVPDLKRDRAASVDSCFNNNKNGGIAHADLLAVPQQNIRSKSVDIVLPTDVRTRYTALVPGKESRLPIGWVRLD